MQIAWSPEADAIIAWSGEWKNGLLISMDGSGENHPVIWEPPIWWLHSFWPYYGGR
jgi:hypothetical protein